MLLVHFILDYDSSGVIGCWDSNIVDIRLNQVEEKE